jgi:hypothetical protein
MDDRDIISKSACGPRIPGRTIMKTAIILISGLLLTRAIHAQSTEGTINFQSGTNLISNALTGMLVMSNDFIKAQLYASPSGYTNDEAFTPVGLPVFVGSPPGRFSGGLRTVPWAPPGTPVNIQVRAWEFTRGGSYEEALTAPEGNGRRALVGKSGIVTVVLGGGTPPAPAPSSLGVGSFQVDVAGGGAYLRVNDIIVAEGSNGVYNAVFTIGLSSAQSNSVQVDFATMNGTAIAGEDYVATNGTVTFDPGESAKTVTVLVTADGPPENEEVFYLVLSNPVNGYIVRPQGSCLITEVRITGISVDTAVSFNTVLSRRYIVEKSSDAQTWSAVSGATNVLGNGSIVTVFDRGAGCSSMTLYRARLLMQ